MPGKFLFCCLTGLAFLSFLPPRPVPPRSEILRKYQLAEADFRADADRAAFDGFSEVTAWYEAAPDSGLRHIAFQSYFKLGIESEVLGLYAAAGNAYRRAATFDVPDSLRFRLAVYAGSLYFRLNNFDSADHFLEKAESLVSPDFPAEDRVRLYNTLGVLYYENGNYLQCKNYFGRAFDIARDSHTGSDVSLASLEINIATAYYRLGLYEAAIDRYRRAARYRVAEDAINLNMGRAYNALNRYNEAVACLAKVNAARLPGVLNELAAVEINRGNRLAAEARLDSFRQLARGRNRLDDGINAYLWAQLRLGAADPGGALVNIQRALNLLSVNFSDPDIRHNPTEFVGSFAYYRLFDALALKGEAWENSFDLNGRADDLKFSLASYQSAIALLSYIEKSYDMDDAKLLLKQRSAAIYQHAMAVCFRLADLEPAEGYLAEAFRISEQNKASVIAANLRARSFHTRQPGEEAILSREQNIRYNIARLNIASDQETDPAALEKLTREKGGYEIELAKWQKQLEKNSRYNAIKYADANPTVADVQRALRRDQAMISYFGDSVRLHGFAITRNSFVHFSIDSAEATGRECLAWTDLLRSAEQGRRFSNAKAGRDLYAKLLGPVRSLLAGKKEWIFVPDGQLATLPFESLIDTATGQYLVEAAAISYQLSSRFVVNAASDPDPAESVPATLAFAPFAGAGADLHDEGLGLLPRLPASAGEIGGLPGEAFSDRAATKQRFLADMNRYPIVHLATHAVADLEDPAASFIAFYPASGYRAEDCLFLEELYAMRMDSCRLVIISACETGAGKLARNEGAISLARAFQYAGCPSTVNSLWKADDRSTAIILRSFHRYLDAGLDKSVALQKAKLDYIAQHDGARNPGFWAHLVLTGSTKPVIKKKQPFFWAAFGVPLLIASLAGLWNWRKKSRHPFPER